MAKLLDQEAEIVEKAKKGDEAAFALIYSTYGPSIRRFIFLQGLQRDETDDALQQVFIKAWRYLPRFEWRDHGISSWLYQIARTVTSDHFRAKKNEFDIDEHEYLIDWKDHPAELINKIDISGEGDRIRKALAQLDYQDRLILILKYAEDLSSREIAKILDKSEVAARKQLSRALANLRLIFKQEA